MYKTKDIIAADNNQFQHLTLNKEREKNLYFGFGSQTIAVFHKIYWRKLIETDLYQDLDSQR